MRTKFKVTRPHLGDKPYAKGDIREADPRKVKHLIKNGVLVETTDDQETDPSNPAENGSGPDQSGENEAAGGENPVAKKKPGAQSNSNSA